MLSWASNCSWDLLLTESLNNNEYSRGSHSFQLEVGLVMDRQVTWEAEAEGCSSRPAEGVLGQPGQPREILSKNQK